MAVTSLTDLEAWLETQPKDICGAITARAALRVWPLVTATRLTNRIYQGEKEAIALLTGWAFLTSSLAVKTPSSEIEQASIGASVFVEKFSAAAYNRYDEGNSGSEEATLVVVDVATDLCVMFNSKNTARSARQSIQGAAAAASIAVEPDRLNIFGATAVYDGFLSIVFNDANSGLSSSDLLSRPLWPSGSEPEWLGKFRSESPDLLMTDPDFTFWARWYDGFVRGEPLDWELQRRVALIDPDIWNEGASAVAKEIAKIEAKYLAEQTQLSETVELNSETGKFRVVPAPLKNAPFMATALSRTQDAIEDALNGNNGLRSDMRAVRVLERVNARHANDPQRIEMDYTSVAQSLRREIYESRELADTEDNLGLLEAVEETVLAVRANHPEVAANRNRLAAQKMRELSQDDIDLLDDALPTLTDLSEGTMQEDFKQDIPRLINDAMLPLPSGAPPLPGVEEATRVFSRVARIQPVYQSTTEKGAATFDSKPVKTLRLGLLASQLIDALVLLGLRIFGVL